MSKAVVQLRTREADLWPLKKVRTNGNYRLLGACLWGSFIYIISPDLTFLRMVLCVVVSVLAILSFIRGFRTEVEVVIEGEAEVEGIEEAAK